MIPLDSPTHPSSIDLSRLNTEPLCECGRLLAADNRVMEHRHRFHDKRRRCASTKLDRSRRRRRRYDRQPIDVDVSPLQPETELPNDTPLGGRRMRKKCALCVTSSRRTTRSQMKLIDVVGSDETSGSNTDDADADTAIGVADVL